MERFAQKSGGEGLHFEIFEDPTLENIPMSDAPGKRILQEVPLKPTILSQKPTNDLISFNEPSFTPNSSLNAKPKGLAARNLDFEIYADPPSAEKRNHNTTSNTTFNVSVSHSSLSLSSTTSYNSMITPSRSRGSVSNFILLDFKFSL